MPHDSKKNPTTYDNPDQLFEELGICRAVGYKGLREGTIPSIRIGKRFIIPRAAIAEWLKTAGGRLEAV
jgi:excisionase family DNA binding protein